MDRRNFFSSKTRIFSKFFPRKNPTPRPSTPATAFSPKTPNSPICSLLMTSLLSAPQPPPFWTWESNRNPNILWTTPESLLLEGITGMFRMMKLSWRNRAKLDFLSCSRPSWEAVAKACESLGEKNIQTYFWNMMYIISSAYYSQALFNIEVAEKM